MKKKDRSHSLFSRAILLLFLLVGIFLILKAFGIPISENNHQDVKTLPPEIKKELQYSSPKTSFRVPILMYHYVEYVKDKNDIIRASLTIHPATFEAQIKTLKDAHYTFLTASELANVLDGKKPIPRKPIILTFDDGYEDFYTDVFPILKKYKVKVTAYIIPGFIDKLNYMRSSELEEVDRSGLVEIGAHTMHHAYLKGTGMILSNKTYEVVESKKVLEKMLNIPIVSFAYPYGAFDEEALEIVKNAGFKTAVSTVPGIEASRSNRFFIFRIRPGGRVGEALLQYLEQSTFKPY